MSFRLNGWKLAQLVMAVGLAAVFGYFVYANAHDDFPLGEALVCAFTWMVVPAAWLGIAIVRRHHAKRQHGKRGFDVLPPADAAPHHDPSEPNP